MYSLDLNEWRKKVATDQMWTKFKQFIVEKYHKLVKETKVTSGDAWYHSANVMQEIGEALEHLAFSATADKHIVTRLTKVVENLTKNNVALTSQISDAVHIYLEMSKSSMSNPHKTKMRII